MPGNLPGYRAAAAAADPVSRRGRGGGGDDDNTLLLQVLGKLDALSDRVSEVSGRMATRDDLGKLVSLEVYTAHRNADAGAFEDLRRRMTAMEQAQNDMREKLHAVELADTRSVTTARLASRAETGATRAQMGETMNKLLFALLGFLGSGFVTLLVYVATHH